MVRTCSICLSDTVADTNIISLCEDCGHEVCDECFSKTFCPPIGDPSAVMCLDTAAPGCLNCRRPIRIDRFNVQGINDKAVEALREELLKPYVDKVIDAFGATALLRGHRLRRLNRFSASVEKVILKRRMAYIDSIIETGNRYVVQAATTTAARPPDDGAMRRQLIELLTDMPSGDDDDARLSSYSHIEWLHHAIKASEPEWFLMKDVSDTAAILTGHNNSTRHTPIYSAVFPEEMLIDAGSTAAGGGSQEEDDSPSLPDDVKKCPSCGTLLAREEGCSHMFCTLCRTPFDWETGETMRQGNTSKDFIDWAQSTVKDYCEKGSPLASAIVLEHLYMVSLTPGEDAMTVYERIGTLIDTITETDYNILMIVGRRQTPRRAIVVSMLGVLRYCEMLLSNYSMPKIYSIADIRKAMMTECTTVDEMRERVSDFAIHNYVAMHTVVSRVKLCLTMFGECIAANNAAPDADGGADADETLRNVLEIERLKAEDDLIKVSHIMGKPYAKFPSIDSKRFGNSHLLNTLTASSIFPTAVYRLASSLL